MKEQENDGCKVNPTDVAWRHMVHDSDQQRRHRTNGESQEVRQCGRGCRQKRRLRETAFGDRLLRTSMVDGLNEPRRDGRGTPC